MHNISFIFVLLYIVTGCASSNKTFKDINGSLYKLYPIAIDHSTRKDLSVLHGTMYDANTKEFLIMASIKAVSDTIFETKTDNNGNYKLVLPEGSYNLVFSYVGYYSVITHDVKVFKYNTQRMDVFMKHPNLE
jgi:hypothetical protein